MAIIVRKNRATQDGFLIEQETEPLEKRHGTAQEQQIHSFPPYDYSGYHGSTIQDYLNGKAGSPYSSQKMCDGKIISCGINIQDRMLQREEMLLQASGEPVVLLRRKMTGERCPCYDRRRGRSRHNCPICFGTNYVGGYVRFINRREPDGRILIRIEPAAEKLDSKESGLWQDHIPSSWTLPVPSLRNRDIIVVFDPEDEQEVWRYEVLGVTHNRTLFRGFGAQRFSLQRFHKSDAIYKVPIDSFIDVTNDGYGSLAGDDGSFGHFVETGYNPFTGTYEFAGYGDGYGDGDYSKGYNDGYQNGYNDNIANKDYVTAPDFATYDQYGNFVNNTPDGIVDEPYGTILAIGTSYENYKKGYMDGYRDGWNAAFELKRVQSRFSSSLTKFNNDID